MKRDLKILSILILAAIAYFGLKYYTRKTTGQRIEEMLYEARKDFGHDITLFDMSYIGFKLDTLIAEGKYSEALLILDTAKISDNLKLDYRGQILLREGKTRESIELFNEAIGLTGNFSKSIPNRAKAYSQLKIYDSAIADYKTIADINFDYYRPLAETYELMKEKDSALRYYKLFLNHPDSVSVKYKIKDLENGG